MVVVRGGGVEESARRKSKTLGAITLRERGTEGRGGEERNRAKGKSVFSSHFVRTEKSSPSER